ncbi:NAD(P)-binding protein [Westerdykella ornata]|uniref:NAD(P)-binding protein n=1 Tax=Westerdykella ornata TaxID=318751 RepID=A0A6A6J531_WESOR|nr:NAD(P)-binding protein [Westerdykella ornata]KAF2271344.1 NAD(P)-binding protein [Westerdykella ornata]
MTTAVLAGSTGLVGSHILTTLLSTPQITTTHAYTRRPLPNPSNSNLHTIQSSDPSTWPSHFPANATLFLSALGTTRAAAGSIANQRKIDLELNYDLAKAAKEHGVETYVLISSSGASATSRFAYPAMKGELEERVKALGFKHCVILRPGLILGERQERRWAEGVARGLAGVLKGVSPGFVEGWAQDAGVIARAAVRAGVECIEGRGKEGVWEIGQGEIVRLGREEGGE